MAVKLIDLNEMKECDVHDASVGIMFPGSSEYLYYKRANARARSARTATPSNVDSMLWSPSTKVSVNCTAVEYISLIDWWMESASNDEDYVESLRSVYGKAPNWDLEILRAFNWLKLHADDKRANIDLFVKGWMRRNLGG